MMTDAMRNNDKLTLWTYILANIDEWRITALAEVLALIDAGTVDIDDQNALERTLTEVFNRHRPSGKEQFVIHGARFVAAADTVAYRFYLKPCNRWTWGRGLHWQ